VAGTGTGSTAAGNGAGAASVGGGMGNGGSQADSLMGRNRPYSLRAIYFRREQFKSTADCLTAAYTQHLPFELCR
jgi:hypothetical protein